MIDLTCPQCKSSLEIDDGFRGGVCRCFSCGTLMTVPDDPGESRAEALAAAPPKPAAEKPAPRTYTTRSGKTMRLSEQQLKKAPVARQPRKSIRVAVTMAVVIFSALLIGGVALLAYFLFRPAPPPAAVDPYANLNDIESNPYTPTTPSFMGLPVGKKTIMVLDGSAAMRSQLDLVKQAALRAIPTLGADHKTQIIIATERSPWVYPEQITPAMQIDIKSLESGLENVSPTGAATLDGAVTQAAQAKPDQVTLVAKALPSAADAKALGQKLKSQAIRLVIVHIDGSDEDPDCAAWKAAAKSTGGRYATVSTARLRMWYEQYLASKSSSEETAPAPAEKESR